MKICLNTDHHIVGHEQLSSWISETVTSGLRHFGDRVTRIEVYLSDEAGGKPGHDDKRCLLEAKLIGQLSVVASHLADTVQHSVQGAIHKLDRFIEHMVGRARDQTRHPHLAVASAEKFESD